MLKQVKERQSNYDEFINDMSERVKKLMGEEYSVRIYKVTKNNSLELDSLVILKKGSNFTPNLYLLPYYEAYLQGAEEQELAEKLCCAYKNYSKLEEYCSFSYSYEEVKPYIIYRLVSYDRNRKLLKIIPHIRYLDLAIIFHCLVREDKDGIGSIRITNEHKQQWGASIQDLYKLAAANTKRLFPPVIRKMDEVILGMLEEEAINGREVFLKTQRKEELLYNGEGNDRYPMHILSNQQGINGAACLLYDKVLKDFSMQLQTDFYIIPSSIHEVILVPGSAATMDMLETMVREVNLTQVAYDEVLSDQVYYYSAKTNSVTAAAR